MNFLIDTHILVWWLKDNDRLKAKILTRLRNTPSLFVSSIALYEIFQKITVGKMTPREDLRGHLSANKIQILPFTETHAEAARLLPLHHRDPFDRMMVGQALVENLTFVTADEQIWRYDMKLLKA